MFFFLRSFIVIANFAEHSSLDLLLWSVRVCRSVQALLANQTIIVLSKSAEGS